jgi:6-phosphogluconolactonase
VADQAAANTLGGARLEILDSDEAIGTEAARIVVDALSAAIDARGVAHIALTGGTSAVPLYRRLAASPARDSIDWGKVHLWWGDERFVPIDHPESNAGLAYRVLLGVPARAGESGSGAQGVDIDAGDLPGLSVNPEHVHPVEVEETLSDSDPLELAAQRYVDELERWLPAARHAVPRFDVILTGVGPDGHILSIFPGSLALAADAPAALAIPAPEHVEPRLPRVTLTASLLPVAGLVVVMASGDGKREMLSAVLGSEQDEQRWPAQAALLPNSVWLLDRAAAPASG